MKAVDRVLESVADKLSGHTMKWYTDNLSVVRMIQHGSRKSYLQDGAYVSNVSGNGVGTTVCKLACRLIRMIGRWILVYSYG